MGALVSWSRGQAAGAPFLRAGFCGWVSSGHPRLHLRRTYRPNVTRFELDHAREAGDDSWIVGCNNHDPLLGCPLQEQGQHNLSVVRVEFRRRLVGYDDAWVARKSTRDPYALTFASRQFIDEPFAVVGESDQSERPA